MYDNDIIISSVKQQAEKEKITLTHDSAVLCFKTRAGESIFIFPEGVQELIDEGFAELKEIALKQDQVFDTTGASFFLAVAMEKAHEDMSMAILWSLTLLELYREEHGLEKRPIVIAMDVSVSPMTYHVVEDNTPLLNSTDS